MDDEEFKAIHRALVADMHRYPGCRVASCDCDSKHGEWQKDCTCLCHFFAMDEMYGKGKWTLTQFNKEAKHPRPKRESP